MDELTDEQLRAYFDTIPVVVEEMGLYDGWEPVIKEVCRRVGLDWLRVKSALFPDEGEAETTNVLSS
jgi:hypothetical protein